MPRINKTNKATPVSADEVLIYDSEDTSDDKSITLSQMKTFCATDITGKQNLITSPTNNHIVTTDGSGQTKDSGIASTSVTAQGNTFNGASQLVQLDEDSKLPAVDGSLITNVGTKNIIQLGTCLTASATAEKAVTLNGFELSDGATILVSFTNANTVTIPTLNVNSTGAKAIYNEAGTAVSATNPAYFPAGSTVEFTYNGTYWVFKKRVIENYVNGYSWYRVYSDGWIEQGGMVNAQSSGNSAYCATFLKSFSDTNYLGLVTAYGGWDISEPATLYSKATAYMYVWNSTANGMYINWEAKGY